MRPLQPARRSAEHFDSLLQQVDSADDTDRRTSDLLGLVEALRSVPEPQARREFVSGLRERLMVAAEAELLAPVAVARDVSTLLTIKPRRTRRERRVGLALGAFAVVGATTSMAVASQGAIPGDSLYPLKRAIESTQAGLSVGDDAKGEAILGDASDRLDEVDKLTRRDQPDATLIASTLDTFADQATEAGDHLMSDYEQRGNEASIAALHTFTVTSIDALSSLEAAIPAAAEEALLNAAQAVLTLDAAADNVCPTCGDAGITEIPGQLLASGSQDMDDAAQTLAGATLPGTRGPSASADAAELQGADQADPHLPSGLDPPTNPVTVPSAPADPATTAPVGGGLQLPAPHIDANTTAPGPGGAGGGKDRTPKTPDLVEVTGTVNDAVNGAVAGVVAGVNDILAGLTGQTPQSPTHP